MQISSGENTRVFTQVNTKTSRDKIKATLMDLNETKRQQICIRN